MKQSGVFLLIFMLLNCSSKEVNPLTINESLLGKWIIIEQYLDPGDGSSTFSPIESDRTIQFSSDGTVEVNGGLCYMSSEVGTDMLGTYEVIADDTADTSHDGVIIPVGCGYSETKIYFDLPLSGNLILLYPCIEGCGQKFKKL